MERLRLTFFGILGLSFMVLTGLGAHWLFSQFLQAEFLAELLIRRTLDIILLFFFGLLLFSNLIAGFSTLLLADDLTLLMSSPIPSGLPFLSRLVFNWSQSSWMVIVFGMPVIASAGIVLNAPIWFYPAVPLLLFPFTVIATAVGCLVTLLLAAWLPARRTRDILIVLAVIGFLLLYVAFRLAEPERFFTARWFQRSHRPDHKLVQQRESIDPDDLDTECFNVLRKKEMHRTYCYPRLRFTRVGSPVLQSAPGVHR